jgi:hypothetical protein
MSIKKMMISRYDETKEPFSTLPIDEMLVEIPEADNLGEEFYERIRQGCISKGYRFKFQAILFLTMRWWCHKIYLPPNLVITFKF